MIGFLCVSFWLLAPHLGATPYTQPTLLCVVVRPCDQKDRPRGSAIILFKMPANYDMIISQSPPSIFSHSPPAFTDYMSTYR